MEDNYQDVLSKYYKFKAKYEEQYNVAKNKVKKKKNLAKKQKVK